MAETTKFWLLVALVCGAFAVAEYMYACEAIRICRDRTKKAIYRIAVALVLLVDCFGFLGCMASAPGRGMMEVYMDLCQSYEVHKNCCGCVSSIGNEIALALVFYPFVWPIFGWMLGICAAAFLIPELPYVAPYCALPRLMASIPLCAIALAAGPVRSIVMYKAPKRSWWKIVFVLYVTYWPVAFQIPYMAGR